MKWWKKPTKWRAETSGGEWCWHCDFELGEDEYLKVLFSGPYRVPEHIMEKTPMGKRRKFHLFLSFSEEDVG